MGAAMAGGASDASAAQVRLGGSDDPVEAQVDVDARDVRHPTVRARVRAGAGGVQAGPVNANVSPRVARPGNNPPSSQTQGSALAAGSSNPQDIHVAPTNVEAQPRVASPGNDGAREQSNGHRRQVGAVNGSASPRVLSDGDSGRRDQSNGSAGNDTLTEPDGREGEDSQGPPPPPAPSLPLLALVGDALRPRPGRRGGIDLVAVNGDVSPRLLSDGDDGERLQANGYEEGGALQAGTANVQGDGRVLSDGDDGRRGQRNGHPIGASNEDRVLDDNQVVAANAIVAPDVLSRGDDDPSTQRNGSTHDSSASANPGDATTGAGDQVLVDNQVLPVNAHAAPDVLSEGDDGSLRQHNGSDDDQSAFAHNGNASTGSGDQVLTDAQVLPVNLAASPDAASRGDGGSVSQHNGSDDDELAVVTNDAGSDADGSAGSGDELLTDAQVLPVAGAVSPDALSQGDDGSLSQHNGSDDDQVVLVTNEGQSGGDGSAGSGDETLADAQVAPVTAGVTPDVLTNGDDGSRSQHNGSDDDQVVIVRNGPGAGGDGSTGSGDQTLVDDQVIPAAAEVSPDLAGNGDDGPIEQHNGSDDDQLVIVTNEGPDGGDGSAGSGDETLDDNQVVPVAGDVTPGVIDGGSDAPANQHNGSDDDQLVIVTNGPGADGDGSAGTGDETLSDIPVVPVGLSPEPDSRTVNRSEDDREVRVTRTPGDGSTGPGGGTDDGGDAGDGTGGDGDRGDARDELASAGGPPDGTREDGPEAGDADDVLAANGADRGERADELPYTGLEGLRLALLGLLAAGSGLTLRGRGSRTRH